MFTRILVPTDFSAPSEAALEYARILAAKFGASLHLLHVLEDPYVHGAFGPVSEMYAGADAPATRAALLRDAQERLAHRITPADRARFRATTEVVVGSSDRMIVEYAGDNGFDLIVMGTHGRTGLAHMVMGSVAEHVVRSAPCPVLTVHSAPQPEVLPVAERRAATAGA